MKGRARHLETEQNNCCINIIRSKSLSRRKIDFKSWISKIAIVALIKNLLSFAIYIYDIVSDALVSKEKMSKERTKMSNNKSIT